MKERPSRQGGAGSGRGPGVPAAGAGGAHGSPEWQGRRGGPGVGQATEDHPDVPVGRRALSRRHRAQLAQVGVQGQAGEAAGGPRAQRGPPRSAPRLHSCPWRPQVSEVVGAAYKPKDRSQRHRLLSTHVQYGWMKHQVRQGGACSPRCWCGRLGSPSHPQPPLCPQGPPVRGRGASVLKQNAGPQAVVGGSWSGWCPGHQATDTGFCL